MRFNEAGEFPSPGKPGSQEWEDEPKQLTIEEIELRKWYKASEFIPPDCLPCQIAVDKKGWMFLSFYEDVFYCNRLNCWMRFGTSQESPDRPLNHQGDFFWKAKL